MVSFKGSFVVCLVYLYDYGVVQGIFCCLFALPLWLWCRSRDLLFFVCFIFLVMVSFKGSFVVCLVYFYDYGVVQGIFVFYLFYLDCYDVVQGSFCCLFVLSLWLWCRSMDLLFFVGFINKSSLERHHNYQDKTNKQQKILERHHNNQDKTNKKQRSL
jgi:uncharacterized membrane protein